MKNVKKILMGAAMAVALAVGASTAQANTIKLLDVSVTGPDGFGEYTYTYSVSLVAETGVTSTINSGAPTPGVGPVLHPFEGDFFALVDFVGYVPGSADASGLLAVLPAAWSTSVKPIGLIPTGYFAPPTPDAVGEPNVIFQYVGSGAAPEALSMTSGTLPLGLITLKSTLPPTATAQLFYEAQDFDSPPDEDQANQGKVIGPSAVPVPAAVWTGGLMLGGLVVRRMRRGR